MELTLSELEQICMEMISFAGEGRAQVHEAIEAFSAGDPETCASKLEDADAMLVKAHQIQFGKLIKPQAQGVKIPFHLLLIHAMDLVMISTSEMDITKKMLSGYQKSRGLP